MILSREFAYPHKLVRDLCYLFDTGHFLNPGNFDGVVDISYVQELWDAFSSEIAKLETDPTVLVAHMQACPDHVIGKYAEQLMAFFIDQHPRLQLLLENFQVVEDGVTVSEVDFIFKDLLTGLVHHWELSYKFYLEYGNDWIGPNARDTLVEKLTTVTSKQFPAVRHVSVQDIIQSPISSALFLKNDLFYKFDSQSDQNLSLWLTVNELDKLKGNQHFWCVLPKNYWFSPAILKPKELDILRWPEVKKLVASDIRDHSKSVLIARLNKQSGNYYEIQRFFVVKENWPELNSD